MSAGSSTLACHRPQQEHCPPLSDQWRIERYRFSLNLCLYSHVITPSARNDFVLFQSPLSLILMITISLCIVCSAGQTILPTTTSNTFTLPQDQKYFTSNQQQQQVLTVQQQIQAQQRQSILFDNNRQRSTSLPSASLQSPERNTFVPTAWRGLPASPASGAFTTGATTSFPIQTTSEFPSANSLANTIQRQQQPKSLKFTLIAGKYWRFNVKTNSLQSSHKERELRLHRNISVNNFIIDDDGWFQYNHQQQQLFAWPSLSTPPTIYYFVLLPSGLDYEADGENVINSGDVVANIVVELIPPLFTGARTLDLDQFIDHKFTLEYLHRHQSYPLLLSQVVSIFDILARNNTPSVANNQIQIPHHTATSQQVNRNTSTDILAALQQNKQSRLLRPLNEYLLIHSSATSDGEFFSLTWTTHPSLVNNTIVPIEECRLSAINYTVSKLSSRSILYPTVDEKFVISYALEGPLTNAQTIIPTERGNYALRLSLSGSCRRREIFEELGLASVSGVYFGLPADFDADQKENTIAGLTSPTIRSYFSNASAPVNSYSPKQVSTSTTSVTESPSTSSSPDRDEEELTEQITAHSITSSSTSNTPSPERSTASNGFTTNKTVDRVVIQNEISSHSEPRSISLNSTISESKSSVPVTVIPEVSISSSDERAAGNDETPPSSPLESLTTPATSKRTSRVELPLDRHTPVPQPTPGEPILGHHSQQHLHQQQLKLLPQQQQQQPSKFQPTAKSLANFLESQPDVRSVHFDTMLIPNNVLINSTNQTTDPSDITNNVTIAVPIYSSATNTSDGVTTTTTSPTASASPNASSQESSLNEDLIGILNEVTEYLVSIAVPIAIFVGGLLLVSILIALCNLCMKKKKSKQFEVGDRFKIRYGSERRQFLKNSSKPVVLEADQKSLSMGGTPQHRLKSGNQSQAARAEYQKMTPLKANDITKNNGQMTTSFAASSRSSSQPMR